MEMNDIEIMSPAGSFEAIAAAIQGGAGAIYFGAGNLNMRAASSNNFSIENIKDIAKICADNNVKSYLTVNTVMYDEELGQLQTILEEAKKAGISAVIASDMAAITIARELGIEVHVSTQLNVSNYRAVKFYSQFADVIVLARELSLDKVKAITEQIKAEQLRGPNGELVRIEIFIHGALCMAVSGKCYLSLHAHNRSANRGACLQSCRRSYTVTDNETGYQLEIDNKYIMSPKDLCTVGFIDKILDAGVTVLKIEGRGRSPEYVKTVTEVYHQAIDACFSKTYSDDLIKELTEKLRSVFNRDFWNGYYLGQTFGEWSNRYGSQATTRKVQIGKVVKYYSKIQVVALKLESGSLASGEKIIVIGPTSGVIELSSEDLRIDGKSVPSVEKGVEFSVSCVEKLRPNDKLFKIVDSDKTNQQ
ncbi:MAG: U32 family peptidase [Candidatus Kapabacteria bacterium]|nr:U32 family peptidase [Candidatus Kapabacteria bacterium]